VISVRGTTPAAALSGTDEADSTWKDVVGDSKSADSRLCFSTSFLSKQETDSC